MALSSESVCFCAGQQDRLASSGRADGQSAPGAEGLRPRVCHRPSLYGTLVAARLSRRHGLPLVVDFRDRLGRQSAACLSYRLAPRRHEAMEGYILRRCAHAVTINDVIQKSVGHAPGPAAHGLPCRLFPRDSTPGALAPIAERRAGRMQVVYSGIFYDAQTPDYFLRALAQLLKSRPEMRARIEAVFVGLLPSASVRLIHALGLQGVVSYKGYVPHREAVAFQCSADVLWMTIGERPGAAGISTGKLFEYMGARKPILALIPPGAAAAALEPYGAHWIVGPRDLGGIENALSDIYGGWTSGTLPLPDEAYVRRFDRRQLSGELARTLNGCVQACARMPELGTGARQ